ncbi:MAG: nucleotidyltransferase family protein [Thiohalocapsa sp.]|jgi:molybdenum cofactor cytidylyltransferase
MTTQALLLAAGTGTRFGGDKLVAPLSDGTPLVLATARALLAAGCEVLAVARDGSDAARLLAPLPGVRVVVCADSALGMGHSLAAGVRASPGAPGWLVALGDMPFIRPQTIAAVAGALRHRGSLVAPSRSGRRGHPVGFGRAWRSELLALSGDAGARDLLDRHREGMTLIETDDPGIHRDLDRPDDPGWGPVGPW